MAKCQRCNGTAKMVQVSAKCSDMFWEQNLKSSNFHEGYVPEWLGGYGKGENAGGDYVQFTICRHCGTVQGNWPNDAVDAKDQFKWGKCS